MNDLKYQSLKQLNQSKIDCKKYINNLISTLIGQKARLKWINEYIFKNTVQEMSITEVEQKLGHKIIIK